MPDNTVRDACYTPITGISYCRTKHALHSCKVSERPLEGIPMNVPPILLSGHYKIMMFPKKNERDYPKCPTPHINLSKPLYIKGKSHFNTSHNTSHKPHIHLTCLKPFAARHLRRFMLGVEGTTVCRLAGTPKRAYRIHIFPHAYKKKQNFMWILLFFCTFASKWRNQTRSSTSSWH